MGMIMEINKKIMVLLFASASMQLTAMQPNEILLTRRLQDAVRVGNIQEVKEALAQGANPNTKNYNDSLQSIIALAVTSKAWPRPTMDPSADYLGILRILLENGVDLNIRGWQEETDLMWATWHEKKDILDAIWLMITVIPKTEREKLLKEREAIIAGELSLKQGKYAVKDIRKFITGQVVECLVDEQMDRIRKFVNLRDARGQTARDRTPKRNMATAELYNFDNPEAYKKIRAEVRNNVKRILFDRATKATEEKR